MKAQIRLGIGAAVRARRIHLAIGALDPREIGVRAALGANRARLRLDDAAHLQKLPRELFRWTLRPGPFQ